jgi:hypothetical protein
MKVQIFKCASGGGSTGGDVVTNVRHPWGAWYQPFGAAASAAQAAINETIPTWGNPMVVSTLTLVTSANDEGLLFVLG